METSTAGTSSGQKGPKTEKPAPAPKVMYLISCNQITEVEIMGKHEGSKVGKAADGYIYYSKEVPFFSSLDAIVEHLKTHVFKLSNPS